MRNICRLLYSIYFIATISYNIRYCHIIYKKYFKDNTMLHRNKNGNIVLFAFRKSSLKIKTTKIYLPRLSRTSGTHYSIHSRPKYPTEIHKQCLCCNPFCESTVLHSCNFISARCNIYISRLCYDVSVRLSVCDGSTLGHGACQEHSGCATQRS